MFDFYFSNLNFLVTIVVCSKKLFYLCKVIHKVTFESNFVYVPKNEG